MGDIVKFENGFHMVKGFTGNYFGFIGEDKYNKPMGKSELIMKNQGICWHPSYDLKSALQSFGKKSLQMGIALKKCKVLLKYAHLLYLNILGR